MGAAITGKHKAIAFDIIPQPNGENTYWIRQFFFEDEQAFKEGKDETASSVGVALTKIEFDFIWDQMFKLKIGEEIQNGEA
jgi:hypothetical protein